MRARSAWWLLKLSGILIMVLGFCLGNAEFCPPVANRLVPEYARGEAGISRLKSRGRLLPKDEGFQTLSKIYFENLARRTKTTTRNVKVDSFQYEPSAAVFGGTAGPTLEVNLSSTSKPAKGAVGRLKDALPLNAVTDFLSGIEHKKLFFIGCCIFLLGVAFECLALGIELISRFRLFLKRRKDNETARANRSRRKA